MRIRKFLYIFDVRQARLHGIISSGQINNQPNPQCGGPERVLR
jgi:hypothetical protein